MLSQQEFNRITGMVIDNFEGGYYHPSMYGSVIQDPRYADSGETMYGLDRKAGSGLSSDPAWGQFWALIDSQDAKNKWAYNSRGGSSAPRLKELAGRIQKAHYEQLAKKYLTPQAKAIVDDDSRLMFHFIYAAWNGAGWFKKFANDINAQVSRGVKDPNKLVDVAIKSRTSEGLKPGSSPNSLIRQGGLKMQSLFSSISEFTSEAMQYAGKNKGKVLGGMVVIVGLTALAIMWVNSGKS